MTGDSFRNQFGRKWVRNNDGKMPSLNQIKNSVILLNIDIINEERDNNN